MVFFLICENISWIHCIKIVWISQICTENVYMEIAATCCETFIQFFPTCLLLTFCWKLDTKYARKNSAFWWLMQIKRTFRWPSTGHMSHVPKKVVARFDPNNGWFPMWSMPTDHFPILRNLIISVEVGTGRLVQLFFAKWLNSLEINDVWWCWTILYSIKTLSEYWWRWWMQIGSALG